MKRIVRRLILWRAPDVEARTPPCGGPQLPSLPERSDRCGMGNRRAHDPTCPTWRAQTLGECARGAERDLLCLVDRVPMEGAAKGPTSEEHGARLSGIVELGRHVGAHPSRAVRGGSRAGGT